MLDEIVEMTGVGRSQWQPFDTVTPAGHRITGYLCRQESDWLGTLALTGMDEVPRLELVPAMPRLHYPYRIDGAGQGVLAIPLSGEVQEARFTRKLDGTAIIFYGLRDARGEVVEVIARTRLQPVLVPGRWGDWQALLTEALPDRSAVEQAVGAEGVVLVFELWGQANPHLVRYRERLALTLHTAVGPRGALPFQQVEALAVRYRLSLVPTLEVAPLDEARLAARYRHWQATFERANAAAGEGSYLEEGAILVLSTAERATCLKCKPPSIEEVHWTVDRHLSADLIRQALLKLRENGYDLEAIALSEIEAFLGADYAPHEIETSRALIARCRDDYREELAQERHLHALVEASGIPPSDLPALLRHLSAHYEKREMNRVYLMLKRLHDADGGSMDTGEHR